MRDRNQSFKGETSPSLFVVVFSIRNIIKNYYNKAENEHFKTRNLRTHWSYNDNKIMKIEQTNFCFQLKLTNINLQVCYCMFLTIASVRETFTTDLALVWIKPLMNSEMSFQISTVWESLRAVYTCIRFGAFEVLLRPVMPRVTNNVGLYEI